MNGAKKVKEAAAREEVRRALEEWHSPNAMRDIRARWQQLMLAAAKLKAAQATEIQE